MKKYLILLTLAILAACTKEVSDDLRPADGRYSMTVTASKMGTKALALEDGTLNATWTADDVVKVYKGDDEIGELTAQSTGATTKLRGSVNTALSETDVLTLKFLSPSYGSQDGTLEYIAANCDYAEAEITVSAVSGSQITTTAANFENRQAVVKFTLIDKADGTTPINATGLRVNDGTNTYTVTPASATNVLYVALPGFSNKTVTLNAIAGGIRYNYEKTGVTFTNNKYYAINVKMVSTNGMLPGEFTINAGGGKVKFSQGNLQYQASTSTWRFAINQYDFVGNATLGNVYENETKCDNSNISGSYTGWIDLFGWGTGNHPTKASTGNGDYSAFTDWGTNAISNGGNTADLWHTLTKDEWAYLFNNRTNAANLRTFATVNGVVGLILMPDGWTADGVSLTITTANYTSNIISLADWNTLESQGCVFLPSAGYRDGTTLDLVQDHGSYWSSMPYESNHAYYLDVKTNGLDPSYQNNRHIGLSVRLVYETPFFLGAGTEADPYVISSEEDWNYLAIKVNSGTSYTGKFFRQTANINVTTMVGISDSRPFSGTYDGYGNMLNVTLNTTESHTAPFRYIENATVKNVITTGTVHSTSNHPSGLVGRTGGTCIIQNCLVSANVGGAQHSGGIVGHSGTSNISIIGCVYSGTLSPASGQFTGGILGWGGDGGGHTLSISNCLFAGTLTGSTSFHPVGIVQNTNNTRTVSNTYYTLAHNLNNEDTHGNSFVNGLSDKGKFARSITAGSDVTVANAGAATVYDVSGITSYGRGILYDGVLYAGNGEAVSLTLSHSAAQSGYTFTQYTVSGGGTLNDPTSNSPTLTMTDANQTINVQWAPPGTINSLFSINGSGDQVYFSQGNLRYTAGSWSFFDNQWDYYTTYSADSWDKFGWSTSATTYGKSTSTTTSDYSGDFVDWGATIGSGWRTLTKDEWAYVFNTRTVNGGTGDGKSYTLGQRVNGQLGIVIYPDNYTGSVYAGSNWASFEAAGCVFLPAAGYRSGTSVGGEGEYGCPITRQMETVFGRHVDLISSKSRLPESFRNHLEGVIQQDMINGEIC